MENSLHTLPPSACMLNHDWCNASPWRNTLMSCSCSELADLHWTAYKKHVTCYCPDVHRYVMLLESGQGWVDKNQRAVALAIELMMTQIAVPDMVFDYRESTVASLRWLGLRKGQPLESWWQTRGFVHTGNKGCHYLFLLKQLVQIIDLHFVWRVGSENKWSSISSVDGVNSCFWS